MCGFDIDGTIRNPGGIPKEMKRGLHVVGKAEIKKVAVTGRGWPAVPEKLAGGFTDDEIFTAPHVCENGGRIAIGDNNLHFEALEKEAVEEVVNLWDQGGLDVVKFFPEDPSAEIISVDRNETDLSACQLHTSLNEAGPSMVYAHPVEPHVNLFPGEINATPVDGGTWYHVNPQGVNKRNGLLRVADMFGLDPSNVAVFGNDHNDRDMLVADKFGLRGFVGTPQHFAELELPSDVLRIENVRTLGLLLQAGLHNLAA